MTTQRITDRPLCYCLFLTREKLLVPFICQRCGECCRRVFEKPCSEFQEPNICTVYNTRPSGCRSYPVWTDYGCGGINCPGFEISQKALKVLRRGYGCHIEYGIPDNFKAKEYLDSIQRAAEKKPELYKELLPAIMELKIVKQIRKEAENSGGQDTRGL